jgi:hypothetical protein
MSKSIRQIQQELDNLEATISEIAEELQSLYGKYLDTLSQSAKKQLILASYQICTQVYPESFLKLSFSQREKLQQKLIDLGSEIQPLLLKSPEPESDRSEQQELKLLAEIMSNLPMAAPPVISETDEEKSELAIPEELENADELSEQLALARDSLIVAAEEREETNSEFPASNPAESPRDRELDLTKPEDLVLWHRRIEKTISKTLDQISKQANKYLQEAKIIPSRLPAKIMEVAIQSEDSGNNNGLKPVHLPNILHLAIETEKSSKKQSSTVAHISLLRLRLSEIEFADTMLNAQRSQIHTLLKRLSKLRQQYRDTQKEYTKAEAEAAWRSSWYEK